MSEEADPLRTFKDKENKDVNVHLNLRSAPAPSAPDFLRPSSPERKFNIRIKQEDLKLLDALAKRRGVSRAHLINRLLYKILHKELMSVQQDDARAWLAIVADDRAAGYNPLERSWLIDAMREDLTISLSNLLEYNQFTIFPQLSFDPKEFEEAGMSINSDVFVGLKKKLEGMPK